MEGPFKFRFQISVIVFTSRIVSLSIEFSFSLLSVLQGGENLGKKDIMSFVLVPCVEFVAENLKFSADLQQVSDLQGYLFLRKSISFPSLQRYFFITQQGPNLMNLSYVAELQLLTKAVLIGMFCLIQSCPF